MRPAPYNLVIKIPENQPDSTLVAARPIRKKARISGYPTRIFALLCALCGIVVLFACCKGFEHMVIRAHHEGHEGDRGGSFEPMAKQTDRQKLRIEIKTKRERRRIQRNQSTVKDKSDQSGLEKVRRVQRCPLEHTMIPIEEIFDWKAKPYLLGEHARPTCYNCELDTLWAHHCQYRSHGAMCPQWLQWKLLDSWISRAKQGSDTMRERLTFTPCDLFPHIQGRTLWLIGDSLTLEWHKALQCFMYEFWDLEQHDLTGMGVPGYPQQGWCSNLAQGTRLCFLRANTAEDIADVILPVLTSLGAIVTDLMVLSTGVWHNNQEQYVRNMTKLAQSYSKRRYLLPTAFWKDAPPQHFGTEDGDFDWSQKSSNCTAPQNVELQLDNILRATQPAGKNIMEGGWRNKLGLPIIEGLGLEVIHTWNETLMMWEYHTNFNPHGGDCTHMCHPSEYQYWVYELYRLLKKISSRGPLHRHDVTTASADVGE